MNKVNVKREAQTRSVSNLNRSEVKIGEAKLETCNMKPEIKKMNNKLIIILILVSMSCQPSGKPGNTTMALEKTEVDMGMLNYKVPQSVTVGFQNTGDSTLVVYNVETSCGCTVPEWTRKPVKPGDSGTISLKYDSDFPGQFRKTVTIFYNGVNSPDTILLKGEVGYPEEGTPKSPKGDF